MMKLFSPTFYIFLTLFSHVYAVPALSPLLLPQNQSAFNFSDSNHGTTRLGNAFECFDASIFSSSRRANYGDCARAIALLPNFHVPGEFTPGWNPDSNPWALPHQKIWLTCQVTVNLKSGYNSEESSWLSINVAGEKIMNACQVSYGDHAKTGGETTVGTGGGISVTLERHRKDSVKSGNGKDGSVTTS